MGGNNAANTERLRILRRLLRILRKVSIVPEGRGQIFGSRGVPGRHLALENLVTLDLCDQALPLAADLALC